MGHRRAPDVRTEKSVRVDTAGSSRKGARTGSMTETSRSAVLPPEYLRFGQVLMTEVFDAAHSFQRRPSSFADDHRHVAACADASAPSIWLGAWWRQTPADCHHSSVFAADPISTGRGPVPAFTSTRGRPLPSAELGSARVEGGRVGPVGPVLRAPAVNGALAGVGSRQLSCAPRTFCRCGGRAPRATAPPPCASTLWGHSRGGGGGVSACFHTAPDTAGKDTRPARAPAVEAPRPL